MSGHPSIRLRLVGWFQRVLDQVREYVAKVLGHDETEAQPRYDIGFWRVVPVNNEVAQREVDRANGVAMLGENIDVENVVGLMNNGNATVADHNRLALNGPDNLVVFRAHSSPLYWMDTDGNVCIWDGIVRCWVPSVESHPSPEQSA